MAESAKTGSEQFGELLRRARERSGISRRDLAEATSLSYPFISQLETGYRQPSPAAIRKLADVLGLSLDEIFDAIGRRADEPRPLAEPLAGSGWITNKSYGVDAARAGGMARPGGGGPAPSAPASTPPVSVTRAPGVMARAAALITPAPTSPIPGIPAPITAPITAAPTTPPPNTAAPMMNAPIAADPAAGAIPMAPTADLAGSAGTPPAFITAMVERAIDLLSALPPADRLDAVYAIQRRVIDDVIEERVRMRERQ